jgi:hypothetical protein
MTALLVGLVVAAQVPRVLQGYPGAQWPLPAGDVALGFLIAASVAGVAIALRWYQDRRIGSDRGGSMRWEGRVGLRWDPALLGMPALVALAVLSPLEGAVSEQYGAASVLSPTSSVFSWGRHVDDRRIAVWGTWEKYPFYGTHLDNHVQYVSIAGPHGTFRDPTTCAEWRRALDGGHYDYLVLFTVTPLVGGSPNSQLGWVSDPNAVLTGRFRDGLVWKLRGPLDPSRCP